MKTVLKKYLLLTALMLATLVGYAKENNANCSLLKREKIKIEFYNVKKGALLSIKLSFTVWKLKILEIILAYLICLN